VNLTPPSIRTWQRRLDLGGSIDTTLNNFLADIADCRAMNGYCFYEANLTKSKINNAKWSSCLPWHDSCCSLLTDHALTVLHQPEFRNEALSVLTIPRRSSESIERVDLTCQSLTGGNILRCFIALTLLTFLLSFWLPAQLVAPAYTALHVCNCIAVALHLGRSTFVLPSTSRCELPNRPALCSPGVWLHSMPARAMLPVSQYKLAAFIFHIFRSTHPLHFNE